MLVPIRLEIEIRRHLGQALIADFLHIALHESVVGAPFDPLSAYSRLLGAGTNG